MMTFDPAHNRFELEFAEKRWLPHITPGGMLDRLVRSSDRGGARDASARKGVVA